MYDGVLIISSGIHTRDGTDYKTRRRLTFLSSYTRIYAMFAKDDNDVVFSFVVNLRFPANLSFPNRSDGGDDDNDIF